MGKMEIGRSPIALNVKPTERDPLRNFKFLVEFHDEGEEAGSIATPFAMFGFMSVGGIGIQTDMIPYREGGDNTIVRKMPGQSDVSPLTMVGGVFAGKEDATGRGDGVAQWEWFKHVFAVQWGGGNTQYDQNFRCNIIVRVLGHPVTRWGGGTSTAFTGTTAHDTTGLGFKFYNCWPASIVFNDLNAGDNSIMITNMTVHHEGFDIYTGEEARGAMAGPPSTESPVSGAPAGAV